MNKDSVTKIFESLSSGIRLDVWRSLVKTGLDGMVAGELSSELNVAPNTLSFHLKAMLHAGLVSVEQEGRFLRYRANLSLMVDLIGYLTEECCGGHPEQCLSVCASSCCAPASSTSSCTCCEEKA
ncbi:MAG: ArsR/SmtB family transcription factor [Vibrionaceae bacterium]